MTCSTQQGNRPLWWAREDVSDTRTAHRRSVSSVWKAAAFAVVGLAAISGGSALRADENRHGLVYSVWFAPPGPNDPEVPPMTVQDQVRYCGAAEEWSRRIWEVTDGSHLIYQVHFYSGYDERPGSTDVVWRRWADTANATLNGGEFRMYDEFKGCKRVFEIQGGALAAHLECSEPGQVCSTTDAAQQRDATCLINGEPFLTSAAEIGWIMAHENAHSHYGVRDEYVENASAGPLYLYHVCVGEDDNQGTDETSMMAKRLLNHWCDAGTHVPERTVRDSNGNILLDGDGQPYTGTTPRHPNGVWVDALDSEWSSMNPLEYSGDYSNVPDFPGLPVPHLDSGNPVPFCVWHTQGDGQPVNDALVLLDKSGSMGFRHPAFEAGPTALEAAASSARAFYDGLRDDRLGGVFAFDTDVTELIPYGPKDEDAPAIDDTHGGNTDLCRAIREGSDAIKAEAPTPDFGGGQQILMSDGRPTVAGCNTDADVLQAAVDACNGGVDGLGVATNTVAFGDADRELLRQVAEVCGAQTTALYARTSELEIDGEMARMSTPLQVRTAVARSGRFARNYHEVLHVDRPLAAVRDDVFVVPPGASELSVEWMGDGFEYLFFGDFNGTNCQFSNLEFELVRPDGSFVSESEFPVEGEVANLTRTIRISDPEPGNWRARITPNEGYFCYPSFAGFHGWGDYDPQVAVVASVRAASIEPSLDVSPVVASRDTAVTITGSITLSGSFRLTGIAASAEVIHDDGSSQTVTLLDDGTNGDESPGDGIYTGIFNAAGESLAAGGYRVVASLVSQAGVATAVPGGDLGLESAGAPLPSAPNANFMVEDSFAYRDCVIGNGLAGNTCGDHFAIPGGPDGGGGCSINLPPGRSRDGIVIETRGIALGPNGLTVSGGVGVRVRNIELVSYDAATRVGAVRFDAEATPNAPAEPRNFRVGFAGQSVHTKDCRPTLRPRFEYAAKLVCGAQPDTRNMQLARGFYATTINVRNPQNDPVSFEKVLSLTIPPGRQQPGGVFPIAIDTLRPQEALAVDCDDIRNRVFGGKLPAPFIEGYVVLRSERRLDVTGLYSTATLNAEGTAEDHSSIHIEPARERRLARKVAEELPDLTIKDIDMNSLRVDCPTGQGSCRTSVDVIVANIGAGDSGPSKLRVTIDPNQSQSTLTDVPTMPAGAAQTFGVTFPAGNNCFDPDCTVCAVADDAGEVDESDETNNQMCKTRGG